MSVVPQKGIDQEIDYVFRICSGHVRVQKLRFLAFPRVLEGLGSSGRLIGSISTYPGPGSQVMTETLGGNFFVQARYVNVKSVCRESIYTQVTQ